MHVAQGANLLPEGSLRGRDFDFKVFGKLFLKDQRAAGCLVGSNKLVARNRYAVTCRILLCGTGACAYCLVTANNVESAKLGRKMRWVQRFVYVMI